MDTKNTSAQVAALQVASMAIGQFHPEFKDPRRLLAALEAARKLEDGPAKTTDRLLTTEAAGALLSMPPRQVVTLIRSGKLRGVRLGWKSYRVPESAVRELAAGKLAEV
jgi:excisionase family DNA binding protein